MKQLLAIIFAATLLVAYAQAQTSTSSTTTSQPTTTSQTTSTTDNSGTVTEYTAGAAITLDPGTGKPVHFIIGPKVAVIGPDGKVLAATYVKKNAKVHLHLVQEGDRTVVDRINVEEAQ
jgi:ABC-type transport system substrate-binding protein